MSPTDEGSAYAGRHEARERALSLLYEAEQKGVPVDEVLAGLPLEPDPFAEDLVRGVAQYTDELDQVIGARATNWRLDRMAMLDRTLLRLGTYELLHRPDVPTAVVIDEAVELAKTYCGDESPRFVNGVLARIADDHPR
jgi:transcription antitermination protein NusB